MNIGTRFKIDYKDYAKLTFKVEKAPADYGVVCSAVDHKGKPMNFASYCFSHINLDHYAKRNEITIVENV